MTPQYEKLQKVLHEIFELDKADLDFGIYRIINQKRKQVDEFLTKSLPRQIRDILSATQTSDKTQLETELAHAIRSAQDLGADPNDIPKITELRSRLAAATNVDALEQEVYSHLASFFKRYYKEGDFISMRRYKKDVYAIPYEGEEVKLHWANHDQYYIKTSEYLKNYAFKIDGDRLVRFQLKEASTEENNNRTQGDQERRFAIYEEIPVEVSGEALIINFTYEPYSKSVKQDELSKKAFDAIKAATPNTWSDLFILSPTEKNPNRTLIEKHLNDFISRNTFDYFIHKDLGGFLRRELDFYIKNEVLFIDDIDTENPIAFTAQLSKIKALKAVAGKIITFLAQIEDFQKKLWLKKKFVIKTDYCITLDRIPQKYYPEIIANQEQLAEWKFLFDITVATIDDLKGEPFLVLDTNFFNEEFKDRLIAEFDNLDEQCDGLLINSENFQALSLISNKFKSSVDCVYIDPPYNAKSSEIIYKNSFKHSSFVSFIYDRIAVSLSSLKSSSIYNTAIDDYEITNVSLCLDSIFGKDNHVSTVVVIHNPRGRNDDKFYGTAHEYMLVYSPDKSKAVIKNFKPTSDDIEQYNKSDEISKYALTGYMRTGNNSNKHERPNLFYPIFIEPTLKKLSLQKEDDQWIEILPINGDGEEKTWRWSQDTFLEKKETEILVSFSNNEWKLQKKRRFIGEGKKPKTIWHDPRYDASTNGIMLMKALFNSVSLFSYPKSIYAVYDSLSVSTNLNSIILDYFSGSGTTGHATIRLNREDGGKRKYILVEMGSYFNSVTKPRIQKVIYTDSWRNGKPQDKVGISQMFKYQILESYEDTLNNLILSPTAEQTSALQFSEQLKEEYLLQYMLDIESRDHLFNIEMFRDPFNYKLKVTKNNELVPTRVDLVETFNYLIGLQVRHIQRRHDIKLVEGITRDGQRTLVIWRNLNTTNEDDLDRVYNKLYDSIRSNEFDQIYINGDHHLDNLRRDENTFKVKMIEETFFNKTFNISEL